MLVIGGAGWAASRLPSRCGGQAGKSGAFECTGSRSGGVGAGLSLWRNALAALDRIGLLGTLTAFQHEKSQTGAIRTPSGARPIRP